MKKLLILWLAFSLFTACENDTNTTTETNVEAQTVHETEKSGQAFIEDDESTPNVLQIAMGSDNHTTLVAAVQAADLENSLVNAGPLTVFAPTNKAFDALPAGTVKDLLKPENKGQLADILKFHVTPGNYDADFLKNFKKLGQANNQNLEITKEGDEVRIGGAKVIASVPAGNGIVHVIDKVLLPPSK